MIESQKKNLRIKVFHFYLPTFLHCASILRTCSIGRVSISMKKESFLLSRVRKEIVFQISRRTCRNRHHSRNILLFQIGPVFRHHLFYDIIGNTGLPGKIAKRQCRLAYRIDDLLRFENVKVFRHCNESSVLKPSCFPLMDIWCCPVHFEPGL